MNERVYAICEEILIYNVVKNYCMYDRVCIFFRKKKQKTKNRSFHYKPIYERPFLEPALAFAQITITKHKSVLMLKSFNFKFHQ